MKPFHTTFSIELKEEFYGKELYSDYHIKLSIKVDGKAIDLKKGIKDPFTGGELCVDYRNGSFVFEMPKTYFEGTEAEKNDILFEYVKEFLI